MNVFILVSVSLVQYNVYASSQESISVHFYTLNMYM